jgi:hypothetical protein
LVPPIANMRCDPFTVADETLVFAFRWASSDVRR